MRFQHAYAFTNKFNTLIYTLKGQWDTYQDLLQIYFYAKIKE